MRYLLIIGILNFLMLKGLIAQEIQEIKLRELDSLMDYYIDNLSFNGEVLIAKNGNVFYNRFVGYANYEWDIPCNSNTRYKIYSITKSFTSLMIFQLIEENKINLDDPLRLFFDSFKSDSIKKITIHNLLTHTSGLKDCILEKRNLNTEFISENLSDTEFIEKYIDNGLLFTPGSKVIYSNSNYYILACIIESVTQKSISDNINERILSPLNMCNTGIINDLTVVKNLASGYSFDGHQYEKTYHVYMKDLKGYGNMYSTALDLLKWDQAFYTNKLISDSSKTLMFTPLIGEYFVCGWGKAIKEFGNNKIELITSSGGYWGYRSKLYRVGNNDFTIIILTNTNVNRRELNKIPENIINLLYSEPYEL